MMKVIELTKENENQYLDQIDELEQRTLRLMREEGREGQLFATGKEDVSEYVHSEENTVIVATSEEGKLEAATYVTQGQKPFTYNDITKYFKYGDKYKEYVKAKYQDEKHYKKDLRQIYIIKIKAFEYAKNRILAENKKYNSLDEFLQDEVAANGFHEKSELREKINKYMSEYIIENYDKDIQNKYEQFYWITFQDISKEFGKEFQESDTMMQGYEHFMALQSEYEEILGKAQLKIYEQPTFDEEKYYSANTSNAVELDTYITCPSNRSSGIARIIVFEGIKKHMERHFKDSESQEIFLCSTLHRDNLSSKYVSEFFGLTDSLYVNRRQGRDREVHICRIPREQAMEYLTEMSYKLAVLYGYNPNQKHITESIRRKILEQQLEYEEKEFARLTRAKSTDKKFNGINVKFIESKLQKIAQLKQTIEKLNTKGGNYYGEE